MRNKDTAATDLPAVMRDGFSWTTGLRSGGKGRLCIPLEASGKEVPGCHPTTPQVRIPLSSQRWWDSSWGRGLRGEAPEPHRPAEEEQTLSGAPSFFSTPAPRSCRLWRPSGCGWPCWTSRSTWKRYFRSRGVDTGRRGSHGLWAHLEDGASGLVCMLTQHRPRGRAREVEGPEHGA